MKKISSKQYALSLLESVQDKKDGEIKAVLDEFAKILKKDKVLNKTDKIIFEFNKFWNEKEGIMEASIESARPLKKEISLDLKNYLLAKSGVKKVLISEMENKKMIGGAIIRFEDKIIDGSLRTRIGRLRKEMEK